MIGTNEDAVAVRTMLDSQPELGYEVRGIIGKPRGRSDWTHLASGTALEQLPALARQTDATGVLLVANALSAAEVHDAIELSTAHGLHVQVWPGFQGLGVASGPPLSHERRNVPLRRIRTRHDLAIRGQTGHRHFGSHTRFADRGTGPAGSLDRHPIGRRRPRPLPTGEDRIERGTLRGLQAADDEGRRRRWASTWLRSTSGPTVRCSRRPAIHG